MKSISNKLGEYISREILEYRIKDFEKNWNNPEFRKFAEISDDPLLKKLVLKKKQENRDNRISNIFEQ